MPTTSAIDVLLNHWLFWIVWLAVLAATIIYAIWPEGRKR